MAGKKDDEADLRRCLAKLEAEKAALLRLQDSPQDSLLSRAWHKAAPACKKEPSSSRSRSSRRKRGRCTRSCSTQTPTWTEVNMPLLEETAERKADGELGPEVWKEISQTTAAVRRLSVLLGANGFPQKGSSSSEDRG